MSTDPKLSESKNKTPSEMASKFQEEWRFFVGLFLGIAVGVPVAVFCLNYLVDQITTIVVALIICLVVLVSTFAVLFVFRKQFLALIFGGATGSIDRLVNETVKTISDTKDGKLEEASRSASGVIREFAAIYVWGRIRWRMISWTLGLVAAIAIYVQGLLIFRQNELFEKQNSIVERQDLFFIEQNKIAKLQAELQQDQLINEQLALTISLNNQFETILSGMEKEINSLVENALSNLEPNHTRRLEEVRKVFQTCIEREEWGRLLGEEENLEPNQLFNSKFRRLSTQERELMWKVSWRDFLLDLKPQFMMPHPLREQIEPFAENLGNQIRPSVPDLDEFQTTQFLVSPRLYRSVSAFSSSLDDSSMSRKARAKMLISLLSMPIRFEQFLNSDFRYCDYCDRALRNISFRSVDLQYSRFENVSLSGVDFEGCDLRNVVFNNCEFLGCRFAEAIMPPTSAFKDCSVDFLSNFDGCVVDDSLWGEEILNVVSHREKIADDGKKISVMHTPIRHLRSMASKGGRSSIDKKPRYQHTVLVHHHDITQKTKLFFRNIRSTGEGSLSVRLTQDDLHELYNGYRHLFHYTSPFKLGTYDFEMPTSIEIELSTILDTMTETYLSNFLYALGKNCSNVSVGNIIPSDSISMEDYFRLKESKPNCSIKFTVPAATLMPAK